ncbi:hypothetical protein CJ030_MR3G026061 [Morella rubra]|uniref:Uncharacterized protein n=1 Tax=Morella rubra TaxID=262757 RepID=A0A6A1VZ09_9ROSI|nr:hypothetical protein CJ030_MR3G026061 [Morella rubra]
MDNCNYQEENVVRLFGSDEEVGNQIPTQAQSIVEGSGTVLISEFKPIPDVDYLQELLAIQQQGPRTIGFFGTRNMGFMHQELIEILSYAMVITKNHIYTSGASGTNAAVIRGALRAEKPELLTVILPQSLKKQPPESQELLSKWLCGYMRRDQDMDNCNYQEENVVRLFGSDEEVGNQIPTQAQSIVEGSGTVLISEFKPIPDVDYLQELLAIQQQGPRTIGFFGTRNMGFMHQELIEILSYAMVITKNHIYTSGASGTNAAVIRGALRAEKPELLTVILPQSLKKQPPESQELLSKVKNVIEKPHNDHLPLLEASRLCNMDIISHVQQVICFAFHDSKLLMETCQEAKNMRKIVTLFYLD